MKKITLLFSLLLLISFVFSFDAGAVSASASLTGPGVVRVGDTITVTFQINGSGIYGTSGALSFDQSQLTLTGTKQLIASPWMVEFNGTNFVAYDNNLSNPIKSNKALFSATFKVKNIAVGTKVTISSINVTASDGAADQKINNISYNATISAPMSTNANLSSLSITNGTISPKFSPNTTTYTMQVPYETSKLDLQAKAEDAKAKVIINNPVLTAAGTTNIAITVTAESGIKKVYTIKVTRAQDPNFKASNNSNLSGIKIQGFLLSPVFKQDITDYVVWLPYETTTLQISGVADKAASVEVIGNENLQAGQDNIIKIICTAEDGTKKEYTVIAKRAAALHEGIKSTPVPSATVSATVSSTAQNSPVPTVVQTTIHGNDVTTQAGIKTWLVIVLIVLGIGAGFAAGYFMKKRIAK